MIDKKTAVSWLGQNRWQILNSSFKEELKKGERLSVRCLKGVAETNVVPVTAVFRCYREALAEAKANGWIK